ncbi:hypothetical protein CEE37_04270 [candidate division LCP-89 bacterium B3_LCP]|uniref:DUF3788 domain-containing protein n=1 Tax=candidate division LCP-89 bacterium B3_LCP TaxID=2012998 RepID=A0A532V3K0_UNCL8|nr:MAG: hypothetical protein CEE37_04270 [candidate division LCP-89 bacterium B3_LCP]
MAEIMALSYFDDEGKKPSDNDLAEALGKTKPFWDEIIKHIAGHNEPITEEWHFGGKNWGWTMRVVRKKRRILYLTPCDGCYTTGIILGGRAMEVVRQTDFPPEIVEIINSSKKYAEGTAIRLEIRTKENLEATKKLADIKIAN